MVGRIEYQRVFDQTGVTQGLHDHTDAIIENGGRAEQRTILTSLGCLAAAVRDCRVGSPALLVLGPAVTLAGELHWHGATPLRYPPVAASGHADAAATAAEATTVKPAAA